MCGAMGHLRFLRALNFVGISRTFFATQPLSSGMNILVSKSYLSSLWPGFSDILEDGSVKDVGVHLGQKTYLWGEDRGFGIV